jgi:hypothetical protein
MEKLHLIEAACVFYDHLAGKHPVNIRKMLNIGEK